MKLAGVICVAVLAAGSAGCSVSTASFNDVASAGGAIVGNIGTPDVAAPASPVAPSLGAFLEGPVGTRLGDADRDKAFQAEVDALAAGDRKTWRGNKGSYGFVTPTEGSTSDGCRAFTHTIYIGGRPQVGKGQGCPGPDGSWRITG